MKKFIHTQLIISLLRNANFWIVLFFILRLYGITHPPLEIAHNWRQVTTNMYARNFLEVDANILYARVDMAGDKTGITAKEFPLFNYLIFLVAKLFGFRHWYGRLINLVFSTLGIFFFHKLLSKYTRKDIAFFSTLILLSSIWFAYTRKILPDSFSTSLAIMGLYFGLEYLFKGRLLNIVLFTFLSAVGILSKIPSLYILGIVVLPILNNELPVKRKLIIVLGGVLILFLNIAWYFYWIPHIVNTYGYAHYPMNSIRDGLKEVMQNLDKTGRQFFFYALYSYLGFALFFVGSVASIVRKNRIVYFSFLISFILFCVFIIKAGHNFYVHNYYIIPFAPVMAFVAGYGVSIFRFSWLKYTILFIIMLEGISNQQHEFHYRHDEAYKLNLEAIADSITDRNDLIVFAGYGNPQELYFTHRKGWVLSPEYLANDENISNLIEKGCKYAFYNKSIMHKKPSLNFNIVFENENYVVFKLYE